MPVLTVLGIPLGLRVDLLVAGFSGSLVAIALLNAVPSTGDTWRFLIRDTVRRMFVALASSLTAGYLSPWAMAWTNLMSDQAMAVMLANGLIDSVRLGVAFAVGGGAQQVLRFAIARISGPPEQGAAT